MNVHKEINGLQLEPGDEVVAAVSHQGYIVIVTKLGALFRVLGESL